VQCGPVSLRVASAQELADALTRALSAIGGGVSRNSPWRSTRLVVVAIGEVKSERYKRG
jgi:hypothetical protein